MPSTSGASGARIASASGCAGPRRGGGGGAGRRGSGRLLGGRPREGGGGEDKVAAIGIRVRRWVTFHGISLNVEPELSHFSGIVPCGVSQHGVTSLVDLGLPVGLDEADAALRLSFE